jgi:hypothetical protein
MTVTPEELKLQLGISHCLDSVDNIDKKLDTADRNSLEAAIEEFVKERERELVDALEKEIQHSISHAVQWNFR